MVVLETMRVNDGRLLTVVVENAAPEISGDPTGIRTRVTGVRGQRPEPLDDGTTKMLSLNA